MTQSKLRHQQKLQVEVQTRLRRDLATVVKQRDLLLTVLDEHVKRLKQGPCPFCGGQFMNLVEHWTETHRSG